MDTMSSSYERKYPRNDYKQSRHHGQRCKGTGIKHEKSAIEDVLKTLTGSECHEVDDAKAERYTGAGCGLKPRLLKPHKTPSQ